MSKQLKTLYRSIDIEDFDEKTFDDVIVLLTKIKIEITEDKGFDLEFRGERGYDSSDTFQIQYSQWETDQEYEKRIEYVNSQLEREKLGERLLYEQLRYKLEENFEPTLFYEVGGKKYWLSSNREIKK